MSDRRIALYARVSTEQQARDHTIASQVAALHERITADEQSLAPEDAYVDEGYSGSVLVRPGLERSGDAVATGEIERVYVLAPDRLARGYAHQVLLMEEFRRAGAEVIFLNHAIGGTAEDDLLLQIQGVIAEYEHPKSSSAAAVDGATRRNLAWSAPSPPALWLPLCAQGSRWGCGTL